MGWDSDPSTFIDEVEKDADELIRKIVLYALKSVVSRSPVQDGIFRGNHNVGIGDADESTNSPANKEGSATIARGAAQISNAPLFALYIITNALPYAFALEHGHSEQAPTGVYGVTFTSLLKRFDNEFR